MADTVIENLITKLSFDFDDKQLEKFDEFVDDAVKGLTAMVAVAGAAGAAVFAFTKSIAESNDELGKFAERVGLDIAALQELGFVAELNGGSIESMNSSLANLSRIASETARGIGAGVEAFGILGVSVTDAQGNVKDADDLLNDVSDSISRLGSQAEKLEFAQKLGIGGDLLLAIQNGSEALSKQRKEARELGFILDEDATKAAADFNDELLRITSIVKGVSNAIGTRLMKQIQPMMKVFVKWFKDNKKLIRQNLSSFLDKMTTSIKVVAAVVGRAGGMILSIVNAMGGWKNTIIAVTALLLTMNASALLMPILAVAAGAGILLILEDFIKFAEGGDSVLGELAKKSVNIEAGLKAVIHLLKLARDGWMMIFGKEGEDALNGLISLTKEWGVSIKENVIDPLVAGFEKVKRLGEKLGILKSESSNGSTKSDQSALVRQPLFTVGEGGVIRRSGNTRNNSTVTNTTNSSPQITISINGGNTEEVKRVVTDTLNEQYSGAKTNLSSETDY